MTITFEFSKDETAIAMQTAEQIRDKFKRNGAYFLGSQLYVAKSIRPSIENIKTTVVVEMEKLDIVGEGGKQWFTKLFDDK